MNPELEERETLLTPALFADFKIGPTIDIWRQYQVSHLSMISRTFESENAEFAPDVCDFLHKKS